MAATELPVLVDGDDGYGDAKNVAHTVAGYEAMGVAAIFIEDQRAPKRCGHMAGKDVIDAPVMAAKLRAAAAARRNPDTFLIARTDARAVHGLDEALRRAELYLEAGADGVFVEAPQTVDELARIGRAFKGVPQMANMLEGGRTPMLPPAELFHLGLAMVAYPTSLIFRVARTIERALADLKAGSLAIENEGVDFETFKAITGFGRWAEIEQRSSAKKESKYRKTRNSGGTHAELAHDRNCLRRDARRGLADEQPGRQAGARQGAACRRRQACAVLPAAHGHRAAGLFP